MLQKAFASKIDNKRILNRAGLRLMDNERYNDAIALLLLNVELYSDDGNLWDSLGEAYFVSGQYGQAKQAFTQAIERKPADNCFWCDNSATRLQQISEAESALESLINAFLQVCREYNQAVVTFHKLQQDVDFHVGVLVMDALDVCSAREKGIGLIKQQ